MGIPIPITSSPQLISRSVSQPYLVYNNGSSTAYLGTDSSVSPTAFAFPLQPGSAFQWTAITTDVYAVADNGKTTSLIIAPEASAMSFGTLSASISGPVNVSGSTVDASGSNVGVSGTVGNIPQNKPTLLATSSNVWLATFGSPRNISAIPDLNVSGYGSVIINVSDNAILPAGAVSSLGMITLTVLQLINGVIVSSYTAEWILGQCNSLLQVPVVGTDLQISGQFISAATGSPNTGTLTIQAIGSSEIVASPIYTSYNPGARGTIPTGGYYNASVGVTTLTEYVNSKNGPANFSLIPSSSSATGNGSIFAVEFTGPATNQLIGLVPPAGGSGVSQQVILPMRPIQVLTRATAVGMLSSLQQ